MVGTNWNGLFSSVQIDNPQLFTSVTTTPFPFTDIETELLDELKSLVGSIEGGRKGTMGESGTVYTGSISANYLEKAKSVIEKAEKIRKGEL